MPQVRFLPDNKAVEVRAGTTLLEAARKAKVQVRSRCSGGLSCLMCKVLVSEGSGLTAIQSNERMKLGSLADKGYRYSCQARVTGNVTAELPEDPLKAAVRAQLLKQQEEDEL